MNGNQQLLSRFHEIQRNFDVSQRTNSEIEQNFKFSKKYKKQKFSTSISAITTYDSVCEGRRLLRLPFTLLTVLLCLVIELFCLGVSNCSATFLERLISCEESPLTSSSMPLALLRATKNKIFNIKCLFELTSCLLRIGRLKIAKLTFNVVADTIFVCYGFDIFGGFIE